MAAGGISSRPTLADTVKNPGDKETVTKGTVPLKAGSAVSVNFGGGLRYYATERLGFRVEYKAYRRVSGDLKDIFHRVAGGIFFQFH